MPLDFVGDLAVFFDPEVFGTSIMLDGARACAIWDAPGDEVTVGQSRIVVDTNMMSIPVQSSARPRRGSAIVVIATGDRFTVAGEPKLNGDRTIWRCELDAGR